MGSNRLTIIFKLILLAFMPLCLALLLIYTIVSKGIDQTALNHLDSVADIQAHRVEQEIEHLFDKTALITSRTKLRLSLRDYLRDAEQTHLTTLEKILGDAVNSVPSITEVMIIDMEGKPVISTSAEIEHTMKPFSPAEWPQRGMLLEVGTDDKHHYNLCIGAPLLLEGEVIGGIISKHNIAGFSSILEDHSGVGDTGETYIMRRNELGEVSLLGQSRFVAEEPIDLFPPVHEENAIIKYSIFDDNVQKIHNAVDYRGQEVFSAFREVETFDWVVAVKIDQEEATATTNRIHTIIWIMVIAAFVLVYLSAEYISLQQGSKKKRR